ncbi:AMP-binding protein [Microbulbifer sp. ZKSA006]|uniref:AMP-binding protein n=1 Tax=Microbulbifer sp. ZKSA006 TaxID=3243390 RepID=UPI0040396E1D
MPAPSRYAEDDSERISYRELVRRSEALAAGLRQQLPIGGRVALCAQNHIGLPSAFLAILVDHSITPTYKRMLFLNGNNRPTAAELIAAHHDAPVAARPGTPPLE